MKVNTIFYSAQNGWTDDLDDALVSLQTGFYCHREGSTDQKGFCDLHHQAMTLTFLERRSK